MKKTLLFITTALIVSACEKEEDPKLEKVVTFKFQCDSCLAEVFRNGKKIDSMMVGKSFVDTVYEYTVHCNDTDTKIIGRASIIGKKVIHFFRRGEYINKLTNFGSDPIQWTYYPQTDRYN